ncbi:hypothetical protein MVEN_00872200 [Mycena venus]|uniref:Uncharacterized protein n=1 Tax=Mycena venus TaxID=2733690 RepID=A0A8H6YHA0_9AGAR|nr:hypothetical protein MVEN_00872200 [Mycena venus]
MPGALNGGNTVICLPHVCVILRPCVKRPSRPARSAYHPLRRIALVLNYVFIVSSDLPVQSSDIDDPAPPLFITPSAAPRLQLPLCRHHKRMVRLRARLQLPSHLTDSGSLAVIEQIPVSSRVSSLKSGLHFS